MPYLVTVWTSFCRWAKRGFDSKKCNYPFKNQNFSRRNKFLADATKFFNTRLFYQFITLQTVIVEGCKYEAESRPKQNKIQQSEIHIGILPDNTFNSERKMNWNANSIFKINTKRIDIRLAEFSFLHKKKLYISSRFESYLQRGLDN